MILSSNKDIKIFKKTTDYSTRRREITRINITKSMIPENIFIDAFETHESNSSGMITDKGTPVTKYTIDLKGFIIISKKEKIVDLLFDVFLGDFEHKKIQELVPELFV